MRNISRSTNSFFFSIFTLVLPGKEPEDHIVGPPPLEPKAFDKQGLDSHPHALEQGNCGRVFRVNRGEHPPFAFFPKKKIKKGSNSLIPKSLPLKFRGNRDRNLRLGRILSQQPVAAIAHHLAGSRHEQAELPPSFAFALSTPAGGLDE